MNELKALADQCICHPTSRGIDDIEAAGEGLKDLIAKLENAQGEIRALRCTEDGLLSELQTLREERTAWRVTAENAEAEVKQARIDALEEAAAICQANASMCSEGVMRLTLEANAAAIESMKGTP